MKRLLLLFLLLVPAIAPAQFTYLTNSNNTITITGYTNSDAILVVPDTIAGLPVTVIGDEAFNGAFNLQSITIPHSVLSIAHAAFNQCSALATVTICNGLTNIGSGAFGFCSSLTNLVIPDSVTTLGGQVFIGCSSLTNIVLGSSLNTLAQDTFLVASVSSPLT